jgi:hypothetical protein
VGCWSGFNGRFLGSGRGVVVDGVEPDAAMAARAAQTYRRVITKPIEEALPLLADDAGYGTLLLLDVLEHLVDPAAVLAELAARFPDAQALVSIPNVAHWSLRKELLLGRWNYAQSGLMDETHLRFFTRATARALFENSGWVVRDDDVEVGQPPLLRLPESKLRILSRWPNLFGVQILFVAEPRSSTSS